MLSTTLQAQPGKIEYPLNPSYPPHGTVENPAIVWLLEISADLLAQHAVAGPLISSSDLGGCITLAARLRLADIIGAPDRCTPADEADLIQQAHRDADQVRLALAQYLIATFRSSGDPDRDTGQVIRTWAAGTPAATLVTGLRAAAEYHRRITNAGLGAPAASDGW